MCADIIHFPHLIMKNTILTIEYDRRNSWNNSISSSTAGTSWFERKLFNHFKQFFRRKSISSPPHSSIVSNRRPPLTIEDSLLTITHQEFQPDEKNEDKHDDEKQEEKLSVNNNENLSISTDPIDLLYDYDQLLSRCKQQQEHDRNEMILRSQTPISIPHADLIHNQSCTIIINWKSYVRLFHLLKREPHLFQQYINEYYSCQSLINQHEQLILNIRTTKSTVDNVLRKFLDEYVTCFVCQMAQTHLVKSNGTWKIVCQLCGSQRTVKRLQYKHRYQQ